MKQNNAQVLKRILDLIKPYMHYLILALILALISVSSTLYAPVLIGEGVDLIVSRGNVNFPGIVGILVRFGVVIAITSVSQWLMGFCTNQITYRAVRDLRTMAFQRLSIVPLKYIDSNSHGDLLSRVITDVSKFPTAC